MYCYYNVNNKQRVNNITKAQQQCNTSFATAAVIFAGDQAVRWVELG
jgi:hypothetical protein